MEKNKEKEFDVFFSKAIKEVGMESPSLDFTKKLLAKIEVKQVKKTHFVYKPIITKYAWGIIAAVFLVVLGYIVTGDYQSNMSWWSAFNLDLKWHIKLPEISISKTYIYCFIGFTVFLGLQVYLIKQHHSKQFSLR
ncbi:hypothetical protein [Maribacter sp.]|uniref:hypothetical protein n=1 Tax=Maribacter sp. TaxID=1897614 RepID=UPI0025B9E476|nr:hypothetical protein [Maribacter sp.]